VSKIPHLTRETVRLDLSGDNKLAANTPISIPHGIWRHGSTSKRGRLAPLYAPDILCVVRLVYFCAVSGSGTSPGRRGRCRSPQGVSVPMSSYVMAWMSIAFMRLGVMSAPSRPRWDRVRHRPEQYRASARDG
jgi:hypothetical protein